MATKRDRSRFLKAYEEYADALFRYCYFKVADRETAKDLLQTAFLRTWAYLADGGTVRDFRPFLYKTVRHLVVDHYRERRAVSLDQLQETGFDHPAPQQRFGGGVDGQQILVLLGRLPASYRDVIFMRYFDDLKVSEIAEVLGKTENAVSVSLHRGIKKLKRLLADADSNLNHGGAI